MKKQAFLFLLLIVFCGVKAQVNLQTGSVAYSIPIYSYGDNSSKLSLNLSLAYTSGQGLKVDNIPSCIGQGWDISGIGSITRIQKGLPDDQYPQSGNWNDVINPKYPPGYLYNNRLINDGCPNSLITYPIFEEQNQSFKNFNEQDADRELDEFVYSFNGQTGSFVLDKQNLGDVVLINNSKIKVTASFAINGINNCRTSINKFTIIDERGIKYDFTALDKTRLTKYLNTTNGFIVLENSPGTLFISEELPLSQKPYIVSNWGLTKVTDLKSGKEIKIEYVENSILREGKIDVQTTFASTYQPENSNCNYCHVPVGSSNFSIKTSVSKNLTSVIKPEVTKIIFPDESYLDFGYGDERLDCAGLFKLSNISLIDKFGIRNFKLQFSQKYYIKNVIDDANQQNKKWARLCLTSLTQYGKTDADQAKPIAFEYYTGTNATEDFVPPIFFHSQDPWGFYNGSSSGTTTTDFLGANSSLTSSEFESFKKLTSYNDVINPVYPLQSGGIDGYGLVKANVKSNYAKNGLLKKITNQFGGNIQFEYEQNTISYIHNKRSVLSQTNIMASSGYNESVVGGVHLSKIIEDDGINAITSEYDYRDELGNSTLWGIEQPKNMLPYIDYYEPLSQNVQPSGCVYRYKFLGVQDNIAYSSPFQSNFLTKATIIGNQVGKQMLKNFLKKVGLGQVNALLWMMEMYNFIYNYVASCSNQAQNRNLRVRSNSITNFSNTLPTIFSSVIVKKSSNTIANNGKSIFEFTTENEYPLITLNDNYPFTSKARLYSWNYGLLKSEKHYDANNNIISEVSNNYESFNSSNISDNTKSCNCDVRYTESKKKEDWLDPNFVNSFTSNDIQNKMKVEFYNIVSGRVELKSTTKKLYKSTGNKIESITNYQYNPTNFLLSSVKSFDSKGTQLESKSYYLEDYNLSLNPILQQMKNDNVVNVPISSETWQTKPGQSPELLSATVTEFGLAPNGDYKPIKAYGLQTDKPVPQSSIGVFDPNTLVRNPSGQSLIIPTTEINYDAIGNPIKVKDLIGNRTSGTVYGYKNTIPIAVIGNASSEDVAYTSFEKEDIATNYSNWNWGYGANIVEEASPTGSYHTKTGSLQSDIISFKNKPYKLTLWAQGNSFTVSPLALLSNKVTGPSINGWTYYEYDVAPTSSFVNLTVSANGKGIDELRLYPKNATMATTTYDVGVGKTSECDINNRISYYEYDGLGRLTKVMDENRNVIKTYEYHFKN